MSEKTDPAASVSAIGLSGDDGINHEKSESDNSLKAADDHDTEVENGQVDDSLVSSCLLYCLN